MSGHRYTYQDIVESNDRVVQAIEDLAKSFKGKDSDGNQVTLAVVVSRLDGMGKKLDHVYEAVENHERRLSKVEPKLGIFAALETGLTLLVGGIAAWLGMRK